MAQKLNQVIAIEKGAKNRVYSAITELHKNSQKTDLYYGFNKTYESKEEGGEQFPPEQKKVTLRADDVLSETKDLFTEIMDITATKDFANITASADVKVGENVFVKDAPVPYLLFLEKQLTDLRTFVDKLPVLDEADDWSKDEDRVCIKLLRLKPIERKKFPNRSCFMMQPINIRRKRS